MSVFPPFAKVPTPSARYIDDWTGRLDDTQRSLSCPLISGDLFRSDRGSLAWGPVVAAPPSTGSCPS